MKYKFDDSILRAYDIRGVVGETLSAKDAYNLGFKFSCYTCQNNIPPQIVVGYDGRLSSKLLNAKLIQGLTDAGSKVTSIGLCPSPMLYYSSKIMNADGAIMITGSHNPANYNGFKMLVRGKSLHGNNIRKLANLIQKGLKKKGTVSPFFPDFNIKINFNH